jgi:hypothetical protein
MLTRTVAVDVGRHGEDRDVEWFGIVAFGRVAEELARHGKGDLVEAMGNTGAAQIQRS